MSDSMLQSKQSLLRALPAVDELLRTDAVVQGSAGLPAPLVARAVREALAVVRTRVLNGSLTVDRTDADDADVTRVDEMANRHSDVTAAPDASMRRLAERAAIQGLNGLRRSLLGRVINGTGVILHTNLGRAPLSEGAVQAVADVARGYSNLEYDVPSGRRGLRDLHGETLLTALTGAEAALVVNNNAAAVLLVLSALADGREVVLSRGEMIEIGGAFRIPEVMEQSGAILKEVGTTNRTHLADYENALGEDTGAILKVHPSNYKVVGFTAEVDAQALAPLARRHDVPLIEDLGSGVLIPTQKYGLAAEPTVQSRIAAGIDVVTFSGDKLLGGPQAGIIVGTNTFVEACRRHPLARALRVDKMTLAALQATLLDYLADAHDQIPIYEMMGGTVSSLRERAEAIVAHTREANAAEALEALDEGSGATAARGSSSIDIRIVDTQAAVGGGSLPGETLPSVAVALQEREVGAERLAAKLRFGQPPVVGRVEGDTVLLDLRTIAPEDDRLVADAIVKLHE